MHKPLTLLLAVLLAATPFSATALAQEGKPATSAPTADTPPRGEKEKGSTPTASEPDCD
jgi:hypothetical protein